MKKEEIDSAARRGESSLITLAEAAERLGVTRQTVSNYARTKAFKTVKIGTRTYFDRAAFESLAADLKDVAEAKRFLAAEKEALVAERRSAEEAVKSAKASNSVLGMLLKVPYSKDVLSAIVGSMQKSDGDAKLMDMFLSETPVGKIAETVGMTESGIRTRILRIIAGMRALPKYCDLEADLKSLRDENVYLKAQLKDAYAKLDAARSGEAAGASPDDVRKARLLHSDIASFDLSVRTQNALKNAGVNTLENLVSRKRDEIVKTRMLGRRSISELDDFLAKLGFEFGTDTSALDDIYVRCVVSEERRS